MLCGAIPLVLTAQLKNTTTTLCWDTSLSMKERDLDKEFSYLESFFTAHPDNEVSLLLFSNGIHTKENFSVRSGHWGLLKERLKAVDYDGGTSFRGLADYTRGGEVLIFTDGHQNTRIQSPYFEGNLTVVNSQAYFNQANLNLLAILSGGELVNFAIQEVADEDNTQEYFGRVQGSSTKARIQRISVKGEMHGVKPGPDGSYAIEAKQGDVLVIEEQGGRLTEKVLGPNRKIDIWLSDNNEIALEEVVVTGLREEEEAVTITPYGERNTDAVGYAVQSITEEQIGAVSTTVNNATQGKFSGVRLGQNDDLSQVTMRPSNSIQGNNYGLIIVDGVIGHQSSSAKVELSKNALPAPGGAGQFSSTAYLDPQNIADITVLKGLAATNRYGAAGANGVLLIRTKSGTYGKGSDKIDLALLNDNIYEGKLKVSSKTLVTPYLKALKSGKNLQEAYAIYLKQRDEYRDEPAFYIDVFQYFNAASQPLALRVLTNVLEDNSIKYNSLRAMLYKCIENGLTELEQETAAKILERFPEKVQSYLDHAIALKSNGRYQDSLEELLRMANGSANPALDFSVLKKTVDAEIKNLVYQQNSKLDLAKLPANYRQNLTYKARAVFEWSYPGAEFELQFVNPQKRFFNWEHTSFNNGPRLQEEWEQGYSREEFEIVGQEAKGDWLINVKYLGNSEQADKTPLFLRCTVFTDFGNTRQKEITKVIRLQDRDTEDQVLKLSIE